MQEMIVTVIVLLATWVVARKYLPATVRRRTAGRSARLLRGAGLGRAALWLEQELPAASTCADGCGSCGNCGPAPAAHAPSFSITPDALKQTIRRS